MKKFQPYLMILMRNDLASMVPGKACAQAAHASSRFSVKQEQARNLDPSSRDPLLNTYLEWRVSTPQDYGTTIVVGVTDKKMREAVDFATSNGHASEIINDPSYSVKDGSVTHYLPMDTCAYVFVHEETEAYGMLKSLPLF